MDREYRSRYTQGESKDTSQLSDVKRRSPPIDRYPITVVHSFDTPCPALILHGRIRDQTLTMSKPMSPLSFQIGQFTLYAAIMPLENVFHYVFIGPIDATF